MKRLMRFSNSQEKKGGDVYCLPKNEAWGDGFLQAQGNRFKIGGKRGVVAERAQVV